MAYYCYSVYVNQRVKAMCWENFYLPFYLLC